MQPWKFLDGAPRPVQKFNTVSIDPSEEAWMVEVARDFANLPLCGRPAFVNRPVPVENVRTVQKSNLGAFVNLPAPVENVRTVQKLNLGARSAASPTANFFSLTITVNAPEPCDGARGDWIHAITAAVKQRMIRRSEEYILVQSVAGGCLTLNGAMRFAAPRNRNDLQRNIRTSLGQELPPLVPLGKVTCIVSTPSEDERHKVYESLRRMAAAAGPGAGGQQHGPPATRTLVVVDSVVAAPGRSAAVAAVAPRDTAAVEPRCGPNRARKGPRMNSSH